MLKIKEKKNFLKLKSTIPKHCRSSENTKQGITKKIKSNKIKINYTWTYHFQTVGKQKIKYLKNSEENKNPTSRKKDKNYDLLS